MAWRPAYSLDELRLEVNTRWPNRSTASDGMIGDPAHAATASDHNPNAAGVVCAFDITNDPANGPDISALATQLLVSPHPDLKYLIWNRQIASRTHGWTIRPYYGDPHTNHIHVSVGVGPDGQSRQPYDDRVPAWLTQIPVPTPGDDENVLHLVKGTNTDEWWLTDWVTKRYIQTADEAAQIIVSTRAYGGKIEASTSNGPITYAQEVVNRVPRNDV